MNIYVGNLDYETTNQSLHNLFAEFGNVVNANVITDRDSGRSKGFGFVEMSEKSEGIKAISKLNGKEVNGREIKVNEAQQKPSGGSNQNRRW
ncbi:MAG: RNA-binding protein [Spirochaetia bacterium]|nr:RNA-binding protein [Spirochaetia bacterium]